MPTLSVTNHQFSFQIGNWNLVTSRPEVIARPGGAAKLPSYGLQFPTILDSGAAFCVIGMQLHQYYLPGQRITANAQNCSVTDGSGCRISAQTMLPALNRFQNYQGFLAETDIQLWSNTPASGGWIPMRIVAKFVTQPTNFHGDRFILLGTQFLHQAIGKLELQYSQFNATGKLDIT